MGVIRGLIACEPAGSYDFQDLLVEIDSRRVKAECEIDDQGLFSICSLPQGLYQVRVREVLSLHQILCPGVQVQIDANHLDHDVVLLVSRPVGVTVLALEQGTYQPVGGLSIYVQSTKGPCRTSSKTDPEGQSEFELAPGQYWIETSVFMGGQSVQIDPEPFTVVAQGRAIQVELSIPARPPVPMNTLECLLVAQWWNSMPVLLEQVRGKVVVLALGVNPFQLPYQRPLDYAEALMGIHRRFGGTRVQIIIVMCSVHESGYPRDMMRQDLENAYLEADDLSFAACVDGDPKQVPQLLQPVGCPSLGATYTLYQARRSNTLFVIDKQGKVRACTSRKDLDAWVQRLLDE